MRVAPPGNIQMWIFTQDIAQLSPFLINPAEYRKILAIFLSPKNSDQPKKTIFIAHGSGGQSLREVVET